MVKRYGKWKRSTFGVHFYFSRWELFGKLWRHTDRRRGKQEGWGPLRAIAGSASPPSSAEVSKSLAQACIMSRLVNGNGSGLAAEWYVLGSWRAYQLRQDGGGRAEQPWAWIVQRHGDHLDTKPGGLEKFPPQASPPPANGAPEGGKGTLIRERILRRLW